jgi:formylglycine-generating enzyme required for sulfatase activity
MAHSRREFLALATRAGAAVLTGCGFGGSSAQSPSFRGRRPGEERVVEGIDLRWCPPGEFLMGSPPAELGRRSDEAQVRVTLSRGFWTARTEVTQGDWKRIVGDFPDRSPSSEFGLGDEFPMYWVNFHEAEEFCARLTLRAHRAGGLPRGWVFQLPSEAQWEYACRAGTRTATAFGDVLRPSQANFAADGSRRDVRPRSGARRVGSYPANAWGMEDMHGNVWEWCRDWYHARLPGGVDPDLYDLPGERNGDGTYSRVRRGGAWIEEDWACRSACRLRYEPPRRSDHIGFRVVAVEDESLA